MSSERLQVLLERLTHVVREDLREVATRHDLKLAQLDALHFLASANRFSDTLSAVVEYVGTTKGTVSQTVSTLVRKGLVRRVKDEGDGRVQHLRLTPSGLAVAAEWGASSSLHALPRQDAAVEPLEALLRGLLAVRGGRPFGVCRACAHHRVEGTGARCALLDLPLAPEEIDKICREHTPRVAAA